MRWRPTGKDHCRWKQIGEHRPRQTKPSGKLRHPRPTCLGTQVMLIQKGQVQPDVSCQYQSVASIDESYAMVGVHVDSTLQEKIRRGEYVDFTRLLPRDKQVYDDHHLELVYKDGQTYFVPAGERDGSSSSINSFHKWELAFRVFSNVYLKEHPERTTELVQYNHIICTAACAYIWENVYTYDREFHMHMSNFPQRSSTLILQQAWTMFLKDRLRQGGLWQK